jgi:hypothetical protein
VSSANVHQVPAAVSKDAVGTIVAVTATTQLYREHFRAEVAITVTNSQALLGRTTPLFKAEVATKLLAAASKVVEATIRTCLEISRAGAATMLSFPSPIRVVMDITAVTGTMDEVATTKARLQIHQCRRLKQLL